jgi:hypothetical protein
MPALGEMNAVNPLLRFQISGFGFSEPPLPFGSFDPPDQSVQFGHRREARLGLRPDLLKLPESSL